jgi:hypothetical protein
MERSCASNKNRRNNLAQSSLILVTVGIMHRYVHSRCVQRRRESRVEVTQKCMSRERSAVRTFNDFKLWWSTCCWSFLLAYHCVCISYLLPHPLKRHPISWLTFPIKGDSSENASLNVNPTSKVKYNIGWMPANSTLGHLRPTLAHCLISMINASRIL